MSWARKRMGFATRNVSHISPETETKKKKKKGTVLGTLFMIALSKDNPRY